MYQVSNHSPRSNRTHARALKRGAALLAISAFTALGSTAALAADECGVALSGGTVTCAPAANPYATGITYVAPTGVTVIAPSTIIVSTTTPATNGITITGAGANSLTGAATVTTTGIGSTGVLVSGVGAQNVSVGAVSATGGSAIVANSTAGLVNITATSAKTTAAALPAIMATATGPITITSGPVTATTGNAINAVSSAGSTSVTLTDGNTTSTGNAAVVIGAGTNANLTVNNGVSLYGMTNGATIASTTGAVINNAGTISGGTLAVSTTGGPATLNNTGTINNGVLLVGANSAINNSRTFNGLGSIVGTNGSVTNTGVINNGVSLAGANSAVTNSGTLNGGATLTGGTGLVNNSGVFNGTASLTGGNGTINNSGTFNGAMTLIGGNGMVNNAGTFNAVGTSAFAPTDTFMNSGVVNVGAGATVPTAVNFTGLGTVVNSGLIDLRNGHVGDVLTLGGAYRGTGPAMLGLDVAPGAAVNADRLVLSGAATGSTGVLIAFPTGSQPVFNTAGTTIVQAGAGSSATAFTTVPSQQSAGLVRYDVQFNAANNSYALVSSPNDSAYSLLSIADAERNLWEKSADAISAQFSSRRDALWSLGDGSPAGRFWMSIAGSRDNVHGARDFGNIGHTTDTSAQQDYFGGQAGLALTGGVGGRGGFAIGVTGGYINSKLKYGRTNDGATFDAVNGGVYVNFTSGNVFANGLAKYDYYWVDANSQIDNFSANLRGHSIGARGELGIRLGSNSLFLEPLATVSYVRTTLNNFNVLGTNVSFDDRDGFRGKLGGRIGGIVPISGLAKMSFYLGGAYVHQFSGSNNLVLANSGQTLTFTGYRVRDYGEAHAGINVAQDKAISGFFEGTYTRTFGADNGSPWQEGYGGRVGISLKF